MRILIASDALTDSWGAERRLFEGLAASLKAMGHLVELVGPSAAASRAALASLVDGFSPEAVHASGDGPCARRLTSLCRERGMAFSTDCRGGGPCRPWAHVAAARVFVSGPLAERRHVERGYAKAVVWTPGVSAEAFGSPKALPCDAPRPLTAWAGSLDSDRAVRAYLESPIPGTRFVVGDGWFRRALSHEFPTARFVGEPSTRAVGALYASLDAFVHTDDRQEFAQGVWEALACGTPVASVPDRPLARMTAERAGVAFGVDIAAAIEAARAFEREQCRALAASRGAGAAAREFAASLVWGTWWTPYDGAALALAR